MTQVSRYDGDVIEVINARNKKDGSVADLNETKSKNAGTNGKIVVAVMLALGVVGGLILSRNMPYTNPAMADPGSPYYSRPTDAQIKLIKEKQKNDLPK